MGLAQLVLFELPHYLAVAKALIALVYVPIAAALVWVVAGVFNCSISHQAKGSTRYGLSRSQLLCTRPGSRLLFSETPAQIIPDLDCCAALISIHTRVRQDVGETHVAAPVTCRLKEALARSDDQP